LNGEVLCKRDVRSREQDETETLQWQYPDETETFEKTPRERDVRDYNSGESVKDTLKANLMRHCTSRARRASTGSVHLAIALQDLSPAVWSRSCPDTGNQVRTVEDRYIRQLPLWRLRMFLCVEDRAICTSSHSPTNLSLPWSKIHRVDGSVHGYD